MLDKKFKVATVKDLSVEYSNKMLGMISKELQKKKYQEPATSELMIDKRELEILFRTWLDVKTDLENI